jgi:hypothetical protein
MLPKAPDNPACARLVLTQELCPVGAIELHCSAGHLAGGLQRKQERGGTEGVRLWAPRGVASAAAPDLLRILIVRLRLNVCCAREARQAYELSTS